MTFDEFKHSPSGVAVGSILQRAGTIERLIDASRRQRPAVEAVGEEIAEAVVDLDDTERKFVGRWVKELLLLRGWEPDRKGRVGGGHLFNRGTIYRPRAPLAANARSGADRLASARRLVAMLEEPPMSSGDLIAARREESV